MMCLNSVELFSLDNGHVCILVLVKWIQTLWLRNRFPILYLSILSLSSPSFPSPQLTDASLDPLTVTHYHFTSWPDHGVPKFATSLISFIRRVQRGHVKDSGRELLIHCSAGVGRTGTFITLDSMLDRMAAKESDVNVYEFVYNMRQRRVLMVQTMVSEGVACSVCFWSRLW